MEEILTSWLSWDRTLKNLIREIFLPICLFLFLGLFWFFKPLGAGPLNTLTSLALFVGPIYWYIKAREDSIDFLVFLNVFLGFFSLDNLHSAFMFPTWVSEIFGLLLIFLFFIYFCFEKGRLKNSLLLGLGLSICLLEVILALSFLPLNPLSKSFVLTVLFYAFWYVVVQKEKYLKYLILTIAALLLTMLATRWPSV